MENEVGRVRLYGMRIVFLLTFIGLAPSAWQEIIIPTETWEPFYGVAVSFWAALSLLALVGFLYPLKMLPLLLLQLLYKLVWLLGVGLPLWQQGLLEGAAKDLAFANGLGVVLDALVIPWLYVAKKYIYKPVW
ncbi:hypothetical protein FKG94_20245 [Exilibacterium tricleocarpae]|uniref:Uncharacterized protein n=1 Tax=Exilibacterium tricleocarpae TaxID=2591008 RepID=A0A545T0B5_9GAMM|nr:hypothetical protein [Exilibacterium tricleocarpae]TQV70665.1 hypothetical protein FKG94_20245 [Exilibacterium tricleocarpae]